MRLIRPISPITEAVWFTLSSSTTLTVEGPALLALSKLVVSIVEPVEGSAVEGFALSEVEGFNDNWAYRQIITVTNNGSAQTNYQLTIIEDIQV